MKFKKTFLIICVMCFFVTLAGAYADDIHDTPISKTNETQRELSDDGKLSEIHQQDNGTFEALDEKISSAPSGSVVYLENDYAAESENLLYIDIKNSIIIDGQGHKIDAKHKVAIFKVYADDVVIKNVTFLNGNIGDGAISWEGHKGRLSDCVFSNNVGSYGAVYWRGLDAVISGCVFQNNSAQENGVLFCEEGKVRISDCVFKDNVANFSSAIFFEGEECLITGCTFINNTSEMSGTIRVYDPSVISESVFIENKGEHVIVYNRFGVSKINNNIFLKNNVADSIIFSEFSSMADADFNWFGNTADNFKDQPSAGNASSSVWLFLNETAKPDSIPLGAASEVRFKLYAYNSTSKSISDYDSSLLDRTDLKISASNGNVDRSVAHFDEPIRFSTVNAGPASVIAAIGNSRFSVDLNVIQSQTRITARPVNVVYSKNKNLIVTLTDDRGSPVKGARITINLKGPKTYITDKNGQVKVNVGKIVPKTYNVKIIFKGNNNFKASQKTVKVTVKKAASKIIAKKKTFKKSVKIKKYTVILKSGKTPIKKVKLTLKIKGKTYKAKTNKKGKATFKIKLAKKGKFKAVIKFKANKYYKKVTKKVKITIK